MTAQSRRSGDRCRIYRHSHWTDTVLCAAAAGLPIDYSRDRGALEPIRDDVWAVLDRAPREAKGVLMALREGRVDGSSYSGTCACLIGTIANLRHCDYEVLTPDESRPAERFFLAIRPGDTPENSEPC